MHLAILHKIFFPSFVKEWIDVTAFFTICIFSSGIVGSAYYCDIEYLICFTSNGKFVIVVLTNF